MAIKNVTDKVSNIVSKFGETYVIPEFQRGYVWSKKDVINLLDSIVKGYPIGSVISWGENGKDSIIDGQQRITSLYHTYNGLGKTSNIHINLDALKEMLNGNSKLNIFIAITNPSSNRMVSVKDVLNENIDNSISHEDFRNLIVLKNMIDGYEIGITQVDTNMGDIVEIFTRVNTKGKNLNMLDIMSAKCYGKVNIKAILEDLADITDKKLVKSGMCDALKILIDIDTQTTLRNNEVLELDAQLISDQIDYIVESFIEAFEYIGKYENKSRVLLMVAAKHFYLAGEINKEFESLCEAINDNEEEVSRHANDYLAKYFAIVSTMAK